MLPPSLIPTNANQLLIVNENVWSTDHYFHIVFSEPSALRFVLMNSIPHNTTGSIQCHHLPDGQYYIVKTDRYSYKATSFSITPEGIGIRDCYNNHISVYSEMNDISERIDAFFQKDYTKPDLYPVYAFFVVLM